MELWSFLATNFWLVLLICSGLIMKRYRPGAIILMAVQIGWGGVPVWLLLTIVILSVLVDIGLQIADESDRNKPSANRKLPNQR